MELHWDANPDIEQVSSYRIEWRQPGAPMAGMVQTTNTFTQFPTVGRGIWQFSLVAFDSLGRQSPMPATVLYTNSPPLVYSMFVERSTNVSGPWQVSTNLGPVEMNEPREFYRLRLEEIP